MGLPEQRIIFSDNGTLSDVSVATGDYKQGTTSIPYVSGEDYLYIGSFLPFNHKYFDLSVFNDQASSVSVDIWDGNQWVAAVDIIDQTSTSGVSLAKDGIISWTTNIDDSSWTREQKSKDVTGLTGTSIYNFYWVRFSWSASLNASTVLDYVGHKFAKDLDLYDEYPEFNDSTLKTSFESGKTDWEEQHYSAAEHIIRDLKRDNRIITADQILDWELFRDAAVHCCAMKIYWGLSQFEKHNFAKSKYDSYVDLGFLNLDLNQNARLNIGERAVRTGYLSR